MVDRLVSVNSSFQLPAEVLAALPVPSPALVQDTANPGLYTIPPNSTLVPDPVNAGLYLIGV